jgi:succinate dehydrogenase / fumarate reductase cytochrome b subunit
LLAFISDHPSDPIIAQEALMGLNQRVGFFQGLKYQGKGPMLAWILHRLTGLGILIFVGVHVLASFFMQQIGTGLGTSINILYESWQFQIVVIFCMLFHAINGLRIAILDIWPRLLPFQRESLWLEWAIFIPVYALTIFILVSHGVAGS